MADLSADHGNRLANQHRRQHGRNLQDESARRAAPPRRCRLRRGPQSLERHDRQAPRAHRPLHTGVADVISAVDFARTHQLLVSVRGGGHNIPGNAVCNGGLMIDLARMRSVRVDPVRRTARAEGGVTWGEFDRETQVFGQPPLAARSPIPVSPDSPSAVASAGWQGNVA